jgi:hypothetical protein
MSSEQRANNLGIPESLPLEEQIRLLKLKEAELKQAQAERLANHRAQQAAENPSS